MLRRCLESPSPRFGMIMAPKPGAGSPLSEYGTMLEIRSVQMLSDGRSMVETWGSFRFRLLERGTLDGYMVGRIERQVNLLPITIIHHVTTPLFPVSMIILKTCLLLPYSALYPPLLPRLPLLLHPLHLSRPIPPPHKQRLDPSPYTQTRHQIKTSCPSANLSSIVYDKEQPLGLSSVSQTP